MDKSQAVSRILWQILVLNIVVAMGKMVVGIMTGTLAIIADGLHSTTDASANIIGLVGQRLAAQPPDEQHPYGHQRFETLATMGIGGMLLLAAWEVLQVAIDRLFNGTTPDIGIYQFGVLLITLVINIGVALYEKKEAQRLQSSILAADANHTRSDIGVTLAALLSLVLVRLGLGWMDAVIGLFIVMIIGRMAWGILRESGNVLVDSAPISAESLTAALRNTPGVQEIIRARSRGMGDGVYVDLEVSIPAVMSTEFAQNIAEGLRARVHDAFPHIQEVQIQMTATPNIPPNDATVARGLADTMGIGVHEIIGIITPQGKVLEMHVEVPSGSTLRDAHRLTDRFEAQLMHEVKVIEVVTHIEPQATLTASPTDAPGLESLRNHATRELENLFPQANWHALHVRRDGRGFALTTHCHLPGDMSIETAHSIAEEAEVHLRATFSQLHRVTIHTEPTPEP